MPFISTQYASSITSALRTLILAVSVSSLLILSTGGAGGQTVEDDHGDDFDTATLVELGSSVDGRIDPGDDRDVFKIDLSEASGPTDLWVYTLGEFDSYGGLYDSTGNPIEFNDDSFFADNFRAFSIRSVVQPGVYYVIAVSFEGEPGDYTFHAQAVVDPGSTIDTAKPLSLGSPDGGTINTVDDADYFKLDFTESKHVIIDAVSADIALIDLALLDAAGDEISANIRPIRIRGFGSLFPIGFTIEEDFEPGTYYLKVVNPLAPDPDAPEPDEPPPPFRPSPYSVFFTEDAEYTELVENCEAETDALSDPQINDPLYACQWHLSHPEWQDVKVGSVWAEGIKGEGINVAVVDDGMYQAHEDLEDNVDSSLSLDFASGGNDIYGRFDHHGTHVAGMIAARDNDIGVRGVAPRATVYGYNFLSGDNSTILNLLDSTILNADVTAVSNNSWGWRDSPGFSPSLSFWRQAIRYGTAFGYDGKGIFYVFTAGNGHLLGDDSNLEEYSNDYGVTAACSVNRQGTRAGYSEMGANLWVCAPSNDRPGVLGGVRGILTTENSDRYYQDFGGTSAAAPIVSGVAALTRDANPDLTWRDVKVILAATAQKNDLASPGWEDGAPMHPVSSTDNYHFNHEYGFGVVNAEGAVGLAKRWTNLPATQHTTVLSDRLDVEIPDAPASGESSTFTHALTLDTDIGFTEFVEVVLAFDHDSFRDLEVLLESPSGAISRLAVPFDTYDGLSSFFGQAFVPLHGSFQFGAAKHLGEDPNGEWKLHVTDRIPVVDGTFVGFGITVYGHERAPGTPTLDSVTVHPGGGMLDVAWTAPDETGDSDISSYDLRYIPIDADETDPTNWTILEDVSSAGDGGELEYTVTELADGTLYNVQVRAVNSSGGGLWSEADSDTPRTSPCVLGEAVRDRTNAGLIHDCEALLEARDTLGGSATLNWSTDTRIWAWDGVIREGDPLRVTKLVLRDRNLDGTIPAALGKLSSLVVLNLHSNMLSGAIPDLRSLTGLEELYLANNELSGGIPESLGNMASVRELWLWGNQLQDTIPDLSGMTGLETLKLSDNMLDGGVPAGSMLPPNVAWLIIDRNPLGGTIPDLSGLTSLKLLWLHNNRLEGSIPAWQELPPNVDDLNLRDNMLTGVIPDLSGLDKATRVRLHNNDLSGEVPATLGDLDSLKQLWLHGNDLTGIAAELGDLADTLIEIELKENPWGTDACVPAELADVATNDYDEAGLEVCASSDGSQ